MSNGQRTRGDNIEKGGLAFLQRMEGRYDIVPTQEDLDELTALIRERIAEVVDLKWPDGTPVRVVSLVEDVAFTFEPKLTKEKFHRLLGHLTKWCIDEIDVHLMSFTVRKDRIDP